MSDPITIGAGVGAGISMLRGGNPIKGAAVGGLGGAGYGAMTGTGWAGNLLSKGGMLSQGATAPTISPATKLMGSPEAISPFTPQGVLGTQTMTPGLTGAEQVLGQAGKQAMAQSAPMYTGSRGMMDTMGGVTTAPGVSNAIMTGDPMASGGGYGTLDRIKDAVKTPVDSFMDFAEQNPRATQVASQVALQNMLQPQPGYQMQVPPAPSALPSKESVSSYVPASLRSQVTKPLDPRLRNLYGRG